MDELVVTYLVANHAKEAESRLQIGTAPLLTRELCLAISRTRHDAEEIVDAFNAQIRTMVKDRSYHRLLHVDWIAADVNGDGVPDYVPYSDHPGPAAPQHPYTLFSLPSGTTPDFFIGGKIYGDWSSVPDGYKHGDPSQPDPRRTTTLFKFVW
jgi:hypothetical protein